MRKPSKTNAVLITIIGVLLIGLFARPDARAWGQPGDPVVDPPFNATEQRRQMILALQQMNTRLGAIETKINSGLTVKVTEMPPVIIKDTQKKDK
jgi:hypothetical protein